MPDTQNTKISKYLFDEVEARLDAIKLDQPADHFLNGEGKYVQVTGGSTPYDDTDIKNSIGTLTDLTTTENTNLVGAINEVNDGKADKATNLAGYGITDAYTKTESDDKYQIKLVGKHGQTVGFDANGNAVAEGTPVMKDQFTFVVNDSQTFNEWIGNDVTNGGDATKYERVYISKGTYTNSIGNTGSDNNIYIVNLTKTGTKKIYAESGAEIQYNGSYAGGTVIGIGYEKIPSDLSSYSVEGLTINAKIDSNGYSFNPICFYNMINLTNCTAKSDCNVKDVTTLINVSGFYNCKDLTSCYTDMKAGKRTEADAHSVDMNSIGFKNCINLLECKGDANAVSNTSKIKTYGFEDCKNMVRCVGSINQKFVVICVAGQSNAVGYDESPIDVNFLSRSMNEDRVKQLGFYEDDNLKVIPLGYCAQNMQDMRIFQDVNGLKGTKGIQLPLANLMLDYIPDDYGVLVLPIAYGGTGFTTNRSAGNYSEDLKKPTDADPNAGRGGKGTAILKWGRDTAYYKTLRDRIIYSLELNPSNLFAGIVWCQGESDAGQAQAHYTAFQQMTTSLFSELNSYNGGALKSRVPKKEWDNDIWYNVETIYSWYSRNCQEIWNNYKLWNPNTYVEIKSTSLDSNETGGTRATAQNLADHYGNNAYQRIVAPRVLQKMIDMNTFTKKVNVVEPEVEIPEITTEVKNHEDSRLVKQDDIVYHLPDGAYTISDTGRCTSNKSMESTFGADGTRVVFGEASMIEFTVKRSLYWLIIESDDTFQNVIAMGIGRAYTKRMVRVGRNSINTSNLVMQEDASLNVAAFPLGRRIRIYKDPYDGITLYYKDINGEWTHWFKVAYPNIHPKKVFGFVAGIGRDEFNGNYASDKNILFEGLKIWKGELDSVEREMDVRLSKIESPMYEAYVEERIATNTDLIGQSSDGTFSIDSSGHIKSTLTIDGSSVRRVYLKDAFKLEFTPSRGLYWLVLRKNSTNNDVLVCGIGKGATGQVATIAENNSVGVIRTSTKTYTFTGQEKVRVYRDGNGNVNIYIKPSNSAWELATTVEARGEFDQQCFGFVTGIGVDEINGSLGASDKLLASLRIWETEPFPLARVFDIRTSN